ncbi:MAG: hypothetical protein GY757_49895 [bacterium]|nr:hypothetical protein [bacterium]
MAINHSKNKTNTPNNRTKAPHHHRRYIPRSTMSTTSTTSTMSTKLPRWPARKAAAHRRK